MSSIKEVYLVSEKNILRHLYFETILLLQLFFKNAHFRCRLRFLMKHFKFHFSLEEIIKPESFADHGNIWSYKIWLNSCDVIITDIMFQFG